MDDTDRKLLAILFEDPRMPLSEIAKRLGMSRQAAHQRLAILAKKGVFREIKAAASNYYLGGVPVYIWGITNAKSTTKVLDQLGKSDLTQSAAVAGGNEILVFGYLRRISQLASYVGFVRSAAEMPEVTVGFPNFGDGINPLFYDGGLRKERYRRFSPLDISIIASLQGNARKPIGDIADELDVSQRTVRRHIEGMRKDGSLDYDAPSNFPSGEEMTTLVDITIKKNSDAVKSAKKLLRIDPLHFVLLRSFSNLPCLLRGLITSDKTAVVHKILKEIEEDENVLGVSPNLLYAERVYDTCWDYDLGEVAKCRLESSER